VADQLDKGGLERLKIKAFTSPKYSDKEVGTFQVSFNPEQFTHVYDVDFQKRQGDGATGSPVRFKKIKPPQYTLKLLFDGTGVTGQKEDVHARIREFFSLVGYDGSIHRPRYLKLLWGKFECRCVLVKANVTYKMFKPDGSPVRAVIDASFIGSIDDLSRVRKAKDSSPDLAHIRTVDQGDTLPLMAYRIYGDPLYYLEVARVNNLTDFRQLEVGRKLVFPPIEKVAND
jgi:hypothetical protein